ncbi:MAG: phosphate ABC transporter substrate-binding protein PstS [Chthonomonadales bacterium]
MMKRGGLMGLASAFLLGCFIPGARAQTITGAGSTFVYPVLSAWTHEYERAHPGIRFNYQSIGSGAGIAQYTAGTVDFGATDAPLSNADLARIPRPTVQIPIVGGAVVLAYNLPGIGSGLKLTPDVIADIYLGKIRTWNDVRIQRYNPGLRLPPLDITVAHRSDGSGTTYIFTSYLSAVSAEWRDRVSFGKSVNWPVGLGASGNAGVAGLVRMSRGGIGYVELAYAVQNRLAFAHVRNRSGSFVAPSVQGAEAAAAAAAAHLKRDPRSPIVDLPGRDVYPIAGFTYLLMQKQPQDGRKGRALVDFVRWAMGPQGRRLAEELYYAPLPEAVRMLNERALAQIR